MAHVTKTIEGGSWLDALHEVAVAIEGSGRRITRVRTRRTRIIQMPERVTGKNGNRDYGKERLRPRTAGWRVRRIFTVA